MNDALRRAMIAAGVDAERVEAEAKLIDLNAPTKKERKAAPVQTLGEQMGLDVGEATGVVTVQPGTKKHQSLISLRDNLIETGQVEFLGEFREAGLVAGDMTAGWTLSADGLFALGMLDHGRAIKAERGKLTHSQRAQPAPPVNGDLPSLTYEALLPPADVATYKRVKRWTMELGVAAREILAEIVGGSIGDGQRSKKEFVNTKLGRYRVSMSYMSDNSTEVAAHDRMGVTPLHLSDKDEVLAFFRAHGVPEHAAYARLVTELRMKFRDGEGTDAGDHRHGTDAGMEGREVSAGASQVSGTAAQVDDTGGG